MRTNAKKIALVNHRYGKEVASGSEQLCRLLAKELKECFDVEVLTSCAIDDFTWANFYPEGAQIIDGIKVYRFPTVTTRDFKFCECLNELVNGNNSPETEIRYLKKQGPNVPDLYDFLHDNYNNYDAIVFMTYIYYTGTVCQLGIPNAIFMPTAHDEMALRLPFNVSVFSNARAMIYLTPEEKELVEKRFPSTNNKPGFIGAFGVDIPSEIYEKEYDCMDDIPYILYAGRIVSGKGCDEMFVRFCRYKDSHPSSLQLLLIGKKDMCIPERDDIVYLGFVDEKKKLILMKNAKFLVSASHYESLSIVALEALALNTPLLVTSMCPVLSGHVKRSGAGYIFENDEDFSRALDAAVKELPEYEEMCSKGKLYTDKFYSWHKVKKDFAALVETLNFNSVRSEHYIDLEFASTYINRLVQPSFEGTSIPVVFSTDNRYAGVLASALRSLMDASSNNHNYDILVLSDRISKQNKSLLLNMVNEKDNFSLRFLEVSDRLDESRMIINNERLSRATFMRLLLPGLLIDYKKVVYLDADIHVCKDVAALYGIDLENKMIGAVRDHFVNEERLKNKILGNHLLHHVGMTSRDVYFNAGVLVLNLSVIREYYTSEKLMRLVGVRKWLFEDQDILNHIALNKVKFINPKWNFFYVESEENMLMMRQELSYNDSAREPYIIHYPGGMLFAQHYEGRRYEELFWHSARKTPFYETLIGMKYGR